MDTKLVLDVVCVHCGSTIHMQKKRKQEQCKLVCPGCKLPLHILFNIANDPQTYSFLSVAQESHKKEEKKEEEKPSVDKEAQKAKKDKTIYKKDKHKARSYDEIPGEDESDEDTPSKKKKPKLRESLFLTRKKLFGLVAERYKLPEGKTIIGRDDEDEPSDISLKGDDTISRRSISIDIVPDDYGFDYILKVLNAANPVRVNGKQIRQGEKIYLDLGDVITLGHTNLKFDNQ